MDFNGSFDIYDNFSCYSDRITIFRKQESVNG